MTAQLPNDVIRPVARKVSRLRLMVRLYVLVEGLAATAAAIGAAFWISLGIDWLLEPPPVIRCGLWIVVIAAVGWTLYRLVWDRLATRLSNESLALLLERHHGVFDEGLITTVEAIHGRTDSPFQQTLLERTARDAASEVRAVSLRRLFRAKPLLRKLAAAIALVGAVLIFAALQEEAFAFWIQRMRLSAEPWPRSVDLKVVGFDVIDGWLTANVARDDDFELTALASITEEFVAPQRIELRYRLADGRRGRDVMTRVGEALPGRDPSQQYRYRFSNVVADLEFDLVGGDDSIRDLQLIAVDRPSVHKIAAACRYPEYLNRQPSVIEAVGRASVPEGTRVVCTASCNKPLAAATVRDAGLQEDMPTMLSESNPMQFQFDLGDVREDRLLLISMRDRDGIETREPYRMVLAAIPDQAPDVSVQLRGIGSAVTPQAVIPVVGEAVDDYGLTSAWYEYLVDDQAPGRRPLPEFSAGRRTLDEFPSFDLAEADAETGQPSVGLRAGQQLTLVLRASDASTLSGEPHVGSSQQFRLDVVTPSELRARLERQELALRQRFEAIFEKMVGTRKLLDRVGADFESDEADRQNSEQNDDQEVGNATRRQQRSSARVAGARQNTAQLSFETLGVADGFEQIVAELVNNRVATEELESRLIQGIAEPLRAIGQAAMPDFDDSLERLEIALERAPSEVIPALSEAKVQGDAVVEAMKAVLDRMLELESYNELVDLLRQIIGEQEELNKRTREEQRERLRRLLED